MKSEHFGKRHVAKALLGAVSHAGQGRNMFNPQRAAARLVFGIVIATVTIASSGSAPSARQFGQPDGRAKRAIRAYAKLPIAFVEDHGQLEPSVRYYAQDPRYAFYLTRDEVVMSFEDEPAKSGVALAPRFPGSSPTRRLEGNGRAPGDVNYFRGTDPAGWRTGDCAIRGDCLSRAVARCRHAAARAGRNAQ